MSFWCRNGVCSNNGRSRNQDRTSLRYIASAGLAVFVLGMVAHAQDRQAPPGLLATFSIAQRLEYSDNPDLDVEGDPDFYGRTVLGFGLESVRNIDRFALDFGTDIEEGRDGQSTLDPDNTFANLLYARETRDAFARIALRYRESDVSGGIDGVDFDQDGNIINVNEGTRVSYGMRLEGAVGREAPVGASFSWNQNNIEYSGSNQSDSSRNDFSGQIDFRITPRVTTSLTAIYRDFDSDGGVDRETTGFGARLGLLATSVDTVDISFSHDRIERSGAQTDTDEGLSGAIGWVRALPDGSLGARYASEISSNSDGRRSFFSVNRRFQLPRGSLALTLGATGADTLGTDPLVQADYVHELPTGVLTFGASQRVNTDSNNNEEINTRLRVAYNQQINNLSSVGLNLSLFDRNELQDNPNDGQRIDLGLTYRHDLTRDWGLVAGISHRFSSEDLGEDRRSNTIFVGLERTFSWSP